VINYTIINKGKPKTAIFVHGLFTNSGYWLPYLPYVRDHRLIILNIDYQFLDGVNKYVDQVTKIIEAEAGGFVDVIISHSLGSTITNQLNDNAYRALFEVCPVYCASRINIDKFEYEIKKKIGFSLSVIEIREMLKRVDLLMAEKFIRKDTSIKSIKYYPYSDPYFSYNLKGTPKFFNGDHFEISQAMSQIQSELSV
jgi:hypothetical protein